MSKRKAISLKSRFEVFKRDSFTCQYCGRKAPDVLLQVDHIKPVSKGGKNNVINLVTSCFECNSGKSNRELSDNTVVEKQRNQLEMLQERREQLELMMKWQEALVDHQELEIEKFLEYFNKVHDTSIELSKTGAAKVKKFLKKFGFNQLINATQLSATKYPELSVEDRFQKLGALLEYQNSSEEKQQAMYIRGVCRNRFSYFDFKYGYDLIKQSLDEYKYEYILDIAKSARNWSSWKSSMEYILNHEIEEDNG